MINRSAFLYLTGKGSHFAQCSTCCFTDSRGSDQSHCTLLGIDVDGDDTCGLYAPGWYSGTESKRRVSIKEAGFLEDTQVRCENCKYGGKKCKLYIALNQAFPRVFQLEEKITPESCCNAWTHK